MVEDVEPLEPKLKILTLEQSKFLVDTHVDVADSWTVDLISASVAVDRLTSRWITYSYKAGVIKPML